MNARRPLLTLGLIAGLLSAPTLAGTEPFAKIPDGCPVTAVHGPWFVPPAPYPAAPPSGTVWIGSDSLWVMAKADGVWRGIGRPTSQGPAYRNKQFSVAARLSRTERADPCVARAWTTPGRTAGRDSGRPGHQRPPRVVWRLGDARHAGNPAGLLGTDRPVWRRSRQPGRLGGGMTPVPVAPRERIETLDVLRGFALLGILAMNIRAMAAPFGAYMYPYALVRLHRRQPRRLHLHQRGVRPEDDGALLDALRRGRAAVRGQADRIRPAAARALVPADVLAARRSASFTPT